MGPWKDPGAALEGVISSTHKYDRPGHRKKIRSTVVVIGLLLVRRGNPIRPGKSSMDRAFQFSVHWWVHRVPSVTPIFQVTTTSQP